MTLPDQPPVFRQPSPAERPWWWQLEDAAGDVVELPPEAEEYSGRRFPSQADAESWVGETWSELVEHGVHAVSLFDLDRQVYGPMSLHA